MHAAAAIRAAAFCVIGLLGFVLEAHAQQEALLARDTRASVYLGGLKLPTLPELERPSVPSRGSITHALEAQQAPAPRCRKGRRALIGALIGTGGAIPLAVLAHTRWENEAANGAAAAATTLVLGAAAGAFIGLATCG